jgi:hypothetical protein
MRDIGVMIASISQVHADVKIAIAAWRPED